MADVVNVSSAAGRVARLNSGVYNATKHGVGAFSESLRQEVTTRHVRVTLIEPGATATELAFHNRPEILEGMAQTFGGIEIMHAEDIAEGIRYAVTQPRRVAVNEILDPADRAGALRSNGSPSSDARGRARRPWPLAGAAHSACPTSSSTPSTTSRGGRRCATSEFRARVAPSDRTPRWVVDGNYSMVRDIVWRRADTVVWFDLPYATVMARTIRRTVRRTVTREELWNGNREPLSNLWSLKPEKSIIAWTATRHRVYRRRYAEAEHDPRWAGIATSYGCARRLRRTPCSTGVTVRGERRRSDRWISSSAARSCSSPAAPTASAWRWPSG